MVVVVEVDVVVLLAVVLVLIDEVDVDVGAVLVVVGSSVVEVVGEVVEVVGPAIGSSPDPPAEAINTAAKTRTVIPARAQTILCCVRFISTGDCRS